MATYLLITSRKIERPNSVPWNFQHLSTSFTPDSGFGVDAPICVSAFPHLSGFIFDRELWRVSHQNVKFQMNFQKHQSSVVEILMKPLYIHTPRPGGKFSLSDCCQRSKEFFGSFRQTYSSLFLLSPPPHFGRGVSMTRAPGDVKGKRS